MTNNIRFDFATEDQTALIHNSLVDMANEEGIGDRFTKTKDEIGNAIFKEKIAECVIGYLGATPVSITMFSLTNRNFNLFAKPGMYIHDIYVL